MSKNQVDILVRRAMIFSKMFTKSFGKPEDLKNIKYVLDNIFAKRLTIELVERANPRMIITKDYQKNNCHHQEGYFHSPLASYCPSLFPSENIRMSHWKGVFSKNSMGTVIILAPTGDHSYALRDYQFTDYLVKHGVNTVLIENPFYGRRKPENQFRSALENVADLFIMGAALITESVFLFKWLNDSKKYPPTMGISGISMGGFNSSLVATNATFPIGAVPCLTWSSAAPIFTLGALSHSVGWKNLEAELDSQRFRDELKIMPDCDWLDKLHASPSEYPNFTTRSQKFLWILMEEFTNLRRFGQPLRPDLAKFIVGGSDEYIRRDGVAGNVREIWPGCEVQELKGVGHVQGFLRNTHHFRNGIIEMLAKTEKVLGSEHQFETEILK